MSESKRLPIGQRIRFVATLTCAPSEDAPALIFARKGDLGRVVGHDCREGHRVVWDRWPEPFGAIHGAEFVAVAEDDARMGQVPSEPSHVQTSIKSACIRGTQCIQ